MKKIITLTESDLINLVKRIVKEQQEPHSDVLEDYIYELEQIYQNTFAPHHDDGVTEEDIDYADDAVGQVLNHAENDENLSDEDFDELYRMAQELLSDIDIEFQMRDGLNEGTRAKKPRPMRSKKSGIKTSRRIAQKIGRAHV